MRTSSPVANRENFAAVQDPARLAFLMQDKVKNYRKWINEHGLVSLWTEKLKNYYGNSTSGNSSQRITPGGSEGELALIKINDLHSLVQEQLVIVTSQRPAGQAKAINSDTKALKSAKIGSAVAEYYLSQLGFEQKFVNCAELALLCDEGYVDLYWDDAAGDPIAVDPETQEPEMSGDCTMRVHAPWNVARDVGFKVEQQKWNIISFTGNKFDFAASFPKFEEQILSCSSEDGLGEMSLNKVPEDSDAIWAHLLVQDRTASVPEGRYSLMIGDWIVLDTDLPYPKFPVERMTPADVIEGATGYAPCNDIMAAEAMTDGLHSIIATNEIKFGGVNLVLPEGNNLKVSDLAKGARVFEMPLAMWDKIKALELCKTPPEVFNYIQVLQNKKERAVGSVASALAQQASQGASGSSMALIQTQAISYNSGTQRSYYRLLSATMTKLVEILRVYADAPRVAAIVGKVKAPYLKQFKYTGKDLDSVSSIVYEIVNPIMQTYGGRLQVGQDLLKAGQVKSPKQYINLVATGQTDVLTEDDEADGMLILEENEALREGRPTTAIITELHVDHIKSHNSLITQDAKENDPDLVNRVQNHVQEHINLWMQASMTNPGILLATGQQPLMPPQGMMPPGGAPPVGAPANLGKQVGGGTPPVVQKAEGVKSPGLPNVAGTKEKPQVPGVTDQLAV